MNWNRLQIFQTLASIVAVYHIILGVTVTFASPDLVVIVTKLYRVTPTINSEFLYLAKFTAAYGLALGVMMAMVALNPRKYRMFAWGAVVLFGVRIFQRLFFFNLLNDAFHVSMSQNFMTIIPIGLLALGLAFFMPNGEEKKNSFFR